MLPATAIDSTSASPNVRISNLEPCGHIERLDFLVVGCNKKVYFLPSYCLQLAIEGLSYSVRMERDWVHRVGGKPMSSTIVGSPLTKLSAMHNHPLQGRTTTHRPCRRHPLQWYTLVGFEAASRNKVLRSTRGTQRYPAITFPSSWPLLGSQLDDLLTTREAVSVGETFPRCQG